MRRKNPKPIDAGVRFGRLVIVRRSGSDARREIVWECRCDCGRVTKALASNLRTGNTTSCGCNRGISNRSRTVHGMSQTPEHNVWQAIHRRCMNPKSDDYADYGGRGIMVCSRWRRFVNFIADMGRRPSAAHSLDRRDNDGPYSPSNCRWATKIEQARNRRNNRFITFNGETLTLSTWEERTGLAAGMIWKRLDLGWSVERALTEPKRCAHG